MEPIISPWLIYFLGISEAFSVVCCIFSVVLGIFILIFTAMAAVEYHDYGADNKDYIKYRKVINKFIAPFVITLSLVIFVPSKNTIIGMIVAKNITKDNIAEAIRIGKSMKDEVKSDLADVIRMIANGGEKDE